jgi:Ca-activated chloride channel family protein
MFRFQHPEYLYLLLLLPALLLLFIYSMNVKKRALKKFGNMKIIRQLMPGI